MMLEQIAQKRRQLEPVLFGVFICCIAFGVGLWHWTREYPLPLFDFYPLYYGGQAWRLTGNAYDFTPVVPDFHQRFTIFQIGNAYPLPAVLLTLPFSYLPPRIAATIWAVGMAVGIAVALRMLKAPFWFLLYFPLIEGLRLEQYSVFVIMLQLFALWAWSNRRLGWLALFCMLILTKPSQGGLFVLLLLWWARNWREQAVAFVGVWGPSFLLDPNWVFEWRAAVELYVNVTVQPVFWPLLIALVPLWYTRDWLTIVGLIQVSITPFPAIYAASTLTLGQLNNQHLRWAAVASFLWGPVTLFSNQLVATASTLVVPIVVVSWLGWRRSHLASSTEQQVLASAPEGTQSMIQSESKD
jgi:hypothetical protein